jgi:hypothetical protein
MIGRRIFVGVDELQRRSTSVMKSLMIGTRSSQRFGEVLR